VNDRQRGSAGPALPLPVTFYTATAQHLPHPDASFDAITCTLALHHIASSDRPAALDEMHRVLRPGGRLRISDFQPLERPRHRSLLPRLLFAHAMADEPLDQAAQLAQSAGFSTIARSDTTVSWIGQVTATKL
jgi:ubiquinone/menaquinone biosynthesis C-methylase UbiE